MANISQFMVVHKEKEVSWQKVEKNWSKLANVESAKWIRTYFNRDEGLRYCVWISRDEAKLKEIFRQLDINWDSIIRVEETIPDIWGKKWDEHLEKEASADTLGF